MRLATKDVEQRYNIQKAENRAAIQLAETKASTARRISAIQYCNEIQTAENKAAREAKLQQIRDQRAFATLGPSKSVINSPMEKPTCLYDTGFSLRHDTSREPSLIERIATDSPVSFEFSDSREDEQTRIRRSQTTGRTIYSRGPSSPTSRYSTYNDDERLILRQIEHRTRSYSTR
jgi:hypothetical protein